MSRLTAGIQVAKSKKQELTDFLEIADNVMQHMLAR